MASKAPPAGLNRLALRLQAYGGTESLKVDWVSAPEAGGVGSFAVQFAKTAGATVYATASTKSVAHVQALGADEVIDYQKQNFELLASDIDLIVDLVGGQVLDKSWAVLSPSGVLASIAATDVVSRAPAGRHGIWLSVKPNTARLATIAQEIADGSLRSTISEVVGFDDLA